MATEQLAYPEFRTFVIQTLDRDPDATFDQVVSRLRTRRGQTLSDDEVAQLREAYEEELTHPTGAHRVTAKEAAVIAAHQPFRPRRIELAGLVVGLLPLFVRLPTTTPSVTHRVTGAVTPGASYDFAALMGGLVAIVLGLVAFRLALPDISRRTLHLALSIGIVLIGVYQTLFGLGVLHQMGLFRAG